MQKKKERIHRCGFTNIDFRTKKDTENLQLYQPWTQKHEFGTMGYSGYVLKPKEHDKILEVSKKINTQKTLVSETPDPKYYRTAQFYNTKRIRMKSKTMFTDDRVAQLDESFIGKDVFTGDSMMISDITKLRKVKPNRHFIDKEKKDKLQKQELLVKEKSDKNKEAIQETQLVNIDAEITLDQKIDISKIKEIRLALRRRYANRTSIRKIFKDWDNSALGEINIYNAHSMINKLGIPINYNETRALIASSNTRHTESLNLEEFIHLVFSDNPALEVDLKKIHFKDDKFYSEGEQIEKLKKNMRINMIEMSKTNEEKFLKEYLRIRIPILAGHFNKEANGLHECDYDTFKNVMRKFPLSEKFTNEPLLKSLYDCSKNENDKLDYKTFINNLLNNKEINDFYNFKERYLDNIKYKIESSSAAIQESILAIRQEEEEKKLIAKEIESEILVHNKHKKEESKVSLTNEINNTVPSTQFINKVFSNREDYFKKHQNFEKSLSAHPSLLKEIQPKSRYGANPPHQNTFIIVQAPENAGTFISEKERFDVRRKATVDIVEKDKEKKKLKDMTKIHKLINVNNQIEEHARKKEYAHNEKDIFSLLQRTMKLYKYENVNRMRNELIE